MKWTPRSGRLELTGCVWLGRYIDKARRHEELEAKPGDLLGEYMFGKNDYLDAQLLRFLAVTDAQALEVVRSEPDDEKAARSILEAGRKTPADCAAFNRAFLRWNAPFLAMIDADEGAANGGPFARLVHGFYNSVIVPPATLAYRLAGRRMHQ